MYGASSSSVTSVKSVSRDARHGDNSHPLAGTQNISLKQKGGSTLGGRKVWFDRDILRLNYDGRGEYLGEFQSDDSILVVLNNGDFYTTNFDLSNHYEDNVSIVEKFDPQQGMDCRAL